MTNRHDQESGEVVHRICADARPAALEPGSLELRPADRLRALALLGEVCSTCLTANWCQSPIRGNKSRSWHPSFQGSRRGGGSHGCRPGASAGSTHKAADQQPPDYQRGSELPSRKRDGRLESVLRSRRSDVALAQGRHVGRGTPKGRCVKRRMPAAGFSGSFSPARMRRPHQFARPRPQLAVRLHRRFRRGWCLLPKRCRSRVGPK